MRILVEVTQEKEELGDEEATLYEKDVYFLLHWGLDYTIIEMNEEMRIGVSYTVAICQNMETNIVRCFRPEQLRILGKTLPKEYGTD